MRKKLFWVLLSVIGWVAPQQVQGQFIGFVGQQTTGQVVFTSQTTSLTSATFSNSGQSAHSLTFCMNAAFGGTIDLEGSTDNVNWVILAVGDYNGGILAVAQCHVLQAGGYFPLIRAKLAMGSGSISAWYSAIASPIPLIPTGIGSLGPLPPMVCDKSNSSGSLATASTTNILGPSNTGDAIYNCGFSISFAAAPAAGSVNILWSAVSGCTSPFTGWQLTTAATTPLLVIVPTPLVSPGGLTGSAQFLCVQNSSGVALIFNNSYASVHVP